MAALGDALNTPWKIANQIDSWMSYLPARLLFMLNGIPWGRHWRFFGTPIIQKHHQSTIEFGDYLQIRSRYRANPIGINHPVIISTLNPNAKISVGQHFAMSGGAICAAESITIGDYVAFGANTTVVDTDFHPIAMNERLANPNGGVCIPVVIEDNVFIGMNCFILKGVTIGSGSMVGANSLVTTNIPPGVIAAGNPARVIRSL